MLRYLHYTMLIIHPQYKQYEVTSAATPQKTAAAATVIGGAGRGAVEVKEEEK